MNDLCVVFDIDDTLYLERDYVYSGFAAIGPWAARWLGIEDFGARCWAAHESGTRGSVFNHVLEDCGVTPIPEVVTALVTLYRTHVPDIHLCPDALAALTAIRTRWPIAVITDGPAISQSRKAEALGLARFASPIILTDLLGRSCSKPSPIAFQKVAKEIPAKRYVYIADNPAKDFTAPSQLGWSSIRVRRPKGLHHGVDQLAVNPDTEVSCCSNLANDLLSLLHG